MKRISILLLIVLVLVFSLGFSMPSVDKSENLGQEIPQGQETCPKDGNWYKVDNLSGCSYDFSIPTGCYVTAYCYKAATYCSGPVPVNPPAEGVFHLVLNPCPHDLSHASFYVDCSTPTPTPTEPPVDPTPTPTEPPVDPTPTPTEPPVDPTPTPTEPPVDPTPTPTEPPVDPTPTPTEPPVDPTPTPTEPPVDPTPTPTEPPVDPTPTPTEPTQPQPTPDVIIPPTGGNGNPVLYYTVGGSILFLLGCTLLTFFRSKRKEV